MTVFQKQALMLLVREFSIKNSFLWDYYFLENGLVMYIWLGSQVNPTFVQSLFGIQAAAHIQPEKVSIRTCLVEELLFFFSVVLLIWIIQYQKMFEHY
jgi:hypothetical protein